MYSTNIYICQLIELVLGIRRTSSEINSCWERVYTKQKAAAKGTDGPMLEYVHIQNLIWNLTMQEPAHYIFLYILLAACRPLSNANIWKWMDIMYIYIYYLCMIISYHINDFVISITSTLIIDSTQVIDSTRFHWNTIQQSRSWQDLPSIALFSNLSDFKVWGFSGLQFI